VNESTTPSRGCGACGLHDICLPAGIEGEALARMDRLTRNRRTLARGEAVFRQGEAFHALYVLRSGATRSTLGDADGGHQVIGFGTPGDVLGIDGLLDDAYRTDAVALERSTLCEVPFARMEEVLVQIPSLHRRMLRVLGGELASEQQHLVAMGRQQAIERVARFVHGLVGKQGRLSRQGDCLKLSMSRADIANYLGLAVETVSRALGRMEETGTLSASGRTLRILDGAALAALAGAGAAPSPQKMSEVSKRARASS
jgi:CRP/FNR family transcriptional regulator, anaerobic regulatory protein